MSITCSVVKGHGSWMAIVVWWCLAVGGSQLWYVHWGHERQHVFSGVLSSVPSMEIIQWLSGCHSIPAPYYYKPTPKFVWHSLRLSRKTSLNLDSLETTIDLTTFHWSVKITTDPLPIMRGGCARSTYRWPLRAILYDLPSEKIRIWRFKLLLILMKVQYW